MFEKLRQKWKVGPWQLLLILLTFALGGSACARAGNWLLNFFISEKNVLYWIIYVPLVAILWPVCVLIISVPLGQWKFFKGYVGKIVGKIRGRG